MTLRAPRVAALRPVKLGHLLTSGSAQPRKLNAKNPITTEHYREGADGDLFHTIQRWLDHKSQANVVPYMSHAAVAQDETEDRYHTQIEDGDVRLFTLDQLDAAFNAGLIHENTYVCLEGDTEWLTLGEVAGLGDEEPVSAPVPVAAPVPHAWPPQSVAPQSAAPTYGALAASPSVLPAAPYSVAPMVMARSIAPVVNDFSFDDDFEMNAMRPKRRAGKIIAGVAVLALAGLGFAVVQSGGIKLPKLDAGVGQASAASLTMSGLKDSATKRSPQAAPVVEAAKVEAPKPVEPAPAAEAAKTPDNDAVPSAKKPEDRFSEDMKAALLNKDKKQAVGQKQKKAARGAVAAKRPAGNAGKSSTGFKTGGSAYDPLNGKL